MPCAEMLKEVVRLMNAHNPHALLGLTPIEQEDVNGYMQVVSLALAERRSWRGVYIGLRRRLGIIAERQNCFQLNQKVCPSPLSAAALSS